MGTAGGIDPWSDAGNWAGGLFIPDNGDDVHFAGDHYETHDNLPQIYLGSITFDPATVVQGQTQLFRITIEPGASDPGLELTGAGVVNNSGSTILERFILSGSHDATYGGNNLGGTMAFFNSASAGSNVRYENEGGIDPLSGGGVIRFYNSSTAGGASFYNDVAQYDNSYDTTDTLAPFRGKCGSTIIRRLDRARL